MLAQRNKNERHTQKVWSSFFFDLFWEVRPDEDEENTNKLPNIAAIENAKSIDVAEKMPPHKLIHYKIHS